MLVHQVHIARQGTCTPARMYEETEGVHPVYMVSKASPRQRGEPQYPVTFIRQWRKHRGMSLETLAEGVGELIGGMTHASLSRIERGLQPYSQPILEAIAKVLNTDAASLIMRNPLDPDGIWSIWDQAKPGQRRIIVDIAKSVLKTGT